MFRVLAVHIFRTFRVFSRIRAADLLKPQFSVGEERQPKCVHHAISKYTMSVSQMMIRQLQFQYAGHVLQLRIPIGKRLQWAEAPCPPHGEPRREEPERPCPNGSFLDSSGVVSIRIFRVFAWGGPNCKMWKIRPTSLILTGFRCKGKSEQIGVTPFCRPHIWEPPK